MNKDKAEVKDDQLVINDKVVLPHECGTEAFFTESARRWNIYIKMLDFLKESEYVFNCAILRTPTGDVRNKCTDLNIERIQFLLEAGYEGS